MVKALKATMILAAAALLVVAGLRSMVLDHDGKLRGGA